jgi:hypothetical protein
LLSHFGPRELAGIILFAALWGILNVTISPAFFQVFHLPFACDLIGFSALILVVWWTKKIGAASFVGFIALIINLLIRPTALQFFGFFAASIVFDVFTFVLGYRRIFSKRLLGAIILFTVSVISAAVAGGMIGLFFLPPLVLASWGGLLGWAGLHAFGGIIGGIIGLVLMNALSVRGIAENVVH